MTPGQTYSVSVTLKNTGTTTWTAANNYKLGTQNPADNTTWGTSRVALTASVAPGAQYTFTYNVTAPATLGTHNFQWGMIREGTGWFGANTPNTAVNITASANQPTLSVQRTPTPLVAGQNHTLTWSSTKATSVTYTCTASGTGFTGSATLAASGTTTAATSAAWVGYPSTCTWKATGAGGSTTQTETMTTVAAPVVDSVTYFHNDIAGTPQLATNASGALVWKENYLPYGQRQAQAPASAGNKLWYTGKPHEEDTGLTYMGARYYMPLVGRFTGMDPVDIVPGQPHSLNRYAYGNNNPYKYVDPDGRFPALLIPLIWAVGGAGTSGAINATAQQLSTGHVQWGGVGGVLDAAGDGMLLGPVFGAAAARGSGAGANAAKGAATDAESAVNGLKLNKALASQAQMGEVGTTMAGAGARVPYRDAARVAKEHGGNAADWVKKSSSSHTARDGATFETHWVENGQTGQRVEFKTKLPGGD
jgi:RHS repeat-associated protein